MHLLNACARVRAKTIGSNENVAVEQKECVQSHRFACYAIVVYQTIADFECINVSLAALLEYSESSGVFFILPHFHILILDSVIIFLQ